MKPNECSRRHCRGQPSHGWDGINVCCTASRAAMKMKRPFAKSLWKCDRRLQQSRRKGCCAHVPRQTPDLLAPEVT